MLQIWNNRLRQFMRLQPHLTKVANRPSDSTAYKKNKNNSNGPASIFFKDFIAW